MECRNQGARCAGGLSLRGRTVSALADCRANTLTPRQTIADKPLGAPDRSLVLGGTSSPLKCQPQRCVAFGNRSAATGSRCLIATGFACSTCCGSSSAWTGCSGSAFRFRPSSGPSDRQWGQCCLSCPSLSRTHRRPQWAAWRCLWARSRSGCRLGPRPRTVNRR